MNYVRRIVSGKKKRYVDEKYNLDLSYITPRIIAMAFPGSGVKTLYRNNLKDVANFLNEKHGSNYKILNLSGNLYATEKFGNRVENYLNWPDHHPPPLYLLFELVQVMHEFLSADINNVIVVNCNAGKGRTGTLICSYLLYSGRFDKPEEAFDYYTLKRFNRGFGVTHSSQKRYVNYFYSIISSKHVPIPKLRAFNKIEISCSPYLDGRPIRVKFEILNNKSEVIYSFTSNHQKAMILPDESGYFRITDSNFRLELCGDVLVRLFNGSDLIGRVSFNTVFMKDEEDQITFPLKQIDPYKFSINHDIQENYSVKVSLDQCCAKESEVKSVDELCEECKKKLAGELANYNKIIEFLQIPRPSYEDSLVLLFREENQDDVKKVMENQYLLQTPTVDRSKVEGEEKKQGEGKNTSKNCTII